MKRILALGRNDSWQEQFIRRRAAAGLDAETFAELYRAFGEAVFNYCFFRVGNRAVAEDLTADAFERVWRARRRYQPERAGLSTWLFTIARHVVTDWQRRQARRPWFSLSDQHPDETLSLEAQVEESEEQLQLRRLLRTLAPAEQELIALKFGAGLTNREIARLTEKSETAVGSAIYRIMQKLRSKWNTTG